MNTALIFLTNTLSALAAQTSTFVHQYQNTTTAEVYDMVSDVALRERIALSTSAFFMAFLVLLLSNTGNPVPEKLPQAHPMVRRSMRTRQFYALE